MKRSVKLLLITLTVLAGWGLVYGLSYAILQWNKLAFTNLSNGVFSGAAILLGLFLVGQLVVLLVRIAAQKGKIHTRVLSALCAAALAAATGFFSFVGVFLFVFSYTPEHVVEKDGEILLARVSSFLQIMVYYHRYENPFVRGASLRGWEDYGNGGHDPFESGKLPEPHRGTFYDEDGNIVRMFDEQS